MPQVITIAGERLFAAKAQANEQLDIDTFIFANVAGLDPNAPIDRTEDVPTADIVHQQAVQQTGRINDNVVVYSTVLDSVTGEFDFNWVGLYSSANQTLVAISHIPTVTKTVTVPGAAGNTLNRNFGIEYSGLAELAGITVAPETWQLDFTARLAGMDELTRQLAADMNGKDWFIEDGFKVVPRATANTFSVTPGAGYVSGLRVELEQEQVLILQSYPQFVYVDAWFDGNASSKWSPKTDFIVSSEEKTNYIDANGIQHYVLKLAVLNSANDVNDLRNVEGLKQKLDSTENRTSALEKKAKVIDLSLRAMPIGNESGIFNGKKGTTILGDSISHGAFAGDLFSHGWTRLLARALNGEYQSSSYGFTPYITLGSGGNISRDIHSVSFVGSWSVIYDDLNEQLISGMGHRSTLAANAIKFELPTFMRRCVIFYIEQLGGGEFDVLVNGALKTTVNTSGAQSSLQQIEVVMEDNRYGTCKIEIVTKDANIVDFAGISYLSSKIETVCNNFSRSGRRLHDVSEYIIQLSCENSHTLLVALGQNDFAQTSQSYIDNVKQRVDWLIQYANENQVRVIVPDFCWLADETNWMRKELQRLADETNGKYLDLPDILRKRNGDLPDENHLINTLGMWVDGSHPNQAGNKWIFENIAKAMGLSCSSKEQALSLHDYAIPLTLDAGAGVENALSAGQLSTVKRSGNSLLINCFLEKEPGGEFPIGDFTISNAFPLGTGIVAQQNTVFPLMKIDGSAVVGGCRITASGEVAVNITASTTFNDLIFQAQLMR